MENNAAKDVHPSNRKAAVMGCSIAYAGALVRRDLSEYTIHDPVSWNEAYDCASADRPAGSLLVKVALLIYY